MTPPRKKKHRATRGFTLVEVTISVAIVGTMFAAAMQTLAAAKVGQYQVVERARGNELARALLAEIVQQPYVDTSGTTTIGPDGGETRATFNDVDDYHNLSESPLTMKDGTAVGIPLPSTWTRTVTVAYVNATTLAGGSVVDTGAKMITVTVKHNARVIATVRAVRTAAP